MAQKQVSYPGLLDNFGKELMSVIEKLKGDTLKPAMVSDVVKTLSSVFYCQQLLTMSYNLSVANYDVLMTRVVASEKKMEDLLTKVAGYSERINLIEAALKVREDNHGNNGSS